MSSNKKLSESIEIERQVERTQTARAKPKNYYMDLRIHSPASLGYLGIEGIDTAPALVRLAKTKGLDLIAVTDFNSGQYIDRIIEAARNTSLTVIPGVVIRCCLGTCKDVTLLCLFPEGCGSSYIHGFLSDLGIPENAFGRKEYLVEMPFDQILSALERHQGLVLPSRMDKTPHRKSVIPILVEEYGFRAFDLAYPDSSQFFATRWPKTKFQLFSFSNANALAQVGSRVAKVKMPDPGFSGIKQLIARSL